MQLFLNPQTHQLQGWGLTSCPNADRNPRCHPNRPPQVLQEIQLPVASSGVCNKALVAMLAAHPGNITKEELEVYEKLFCWGGKEV